MSALSMSFLIYLFNANKRESLIAMLEVEWNWAQLLKLKNLAVLSCFNNQLKEMKS